MKKISILFVLSTIIMLNGCENHKNSSQETAKPVKSTKVQKSVKQIPKEITLHSVNAKDITFIQNGETLKLKNNSDSIVLLNFFATWCPPCKAEIPHLINLQNKYKNNLKIIAVLLEDEKPDSEVNSFIKYNGINYTVTNGKEDFALSNLLGGIQNIPFMILYDKNGNIITHYIGIIPEEMVDADIKKAIGK